MPRPDLIALTPDDLAAVANRGLVKRAQRECEAGELTAQWDVSGDGTIRATWSDGVACTLPGGGTVSDAQCSCGALDLCRHVLRTVLAWQQRQAAATADGESRAAAPEPWDPGRIDDAALERQVAKAVLVRAAGLWSQGVLAELLRSAKPSASFHCPGHTVRFPVPDDLRYAQCSCTDPAPCVHAVLAVRAFRLLDAGASSGIVSEGPLDTPAPRATLDAAESCVRDLLADGLASLGLPWRDRARRVSSECAAASLTWPAQILEEMAEDFDRYTARDAAFTPAQTAERTGELLLRLDAIRASCAPVPQAFIRGMTTDCDSDLGPARFIGLGATMTESRRSSRLTVFLQNSDNGRIMTVAKDFAEEDADSPALRKPFHELARAPAVKGASLAGLSAGQLVTQGGRRTASGRLVIGRARAVVNPQNYAWEHLKAPTLVEDFAELTARLRLLPPASFRPRREAADFHVCPLDGVDHAAFDPATNAIVAVLRDRAGAAAQLWHPWTTRGAPGAEALLAALTSGAKPLFVAGQVRPSGPALLIRPTAVVFAGEGDSRWAVMPWLGAPAATLAAAAQPQRLGTGRVHARYAAATELAAELVLSGVRRAGARGWPGWSRAIAEAEEGGYHRMAAVMRKVQDGDDPEATLGMLKLLALARDAA
jgi:hypothetical protein